MVKVNKMKLEGLIVNFRECLEDLEFAIENLDSALDEKWERLIRNSIRNGVALIFTNAEDYLGMVLKKLGVGVTDKTFRDCLKLAEDNDLIDKDYSRCLSKSVNLRNSFSHKYNVPSVEVFVKFFLDNKNVFYKHLEFMIDLAKSIPNELDRSSEFK